MAVRKFYVDRPRDGYQYDRKEGRYFSWGFDVWIGGERIRERGMPTRQAAEKVIGELRTVAREERYGISPTYESPTLFDLFQKKLNAMATGPERSRAKRVMKDFLALVPANIKVKDLRSAHIQAYIDERAVDGVTAATIRRELVPVMAALNSAPLHFAALQNYRPPKIARPKISKPLKSRVITQEESKALIGWLLDPANDKGRGLYRRTGLFLQMCLLTASRPGEIAQLKKSDVDIDLGRLRIEGSKTRFESLAGLRHIDISPAMERILKERMELAPTEFLFTRGGRVTSKMYDALKAACEAHGIEYGRNSDLGITFNRSRHTGITNMLRSGVDIQTIGAIVGHSNSTMTMHYARGDSEAKKNAILELEKRFAAE
jgi:integrase/recombinase XerC